MNGFRALIRAIKKYLMRDSYLQVVKQINKFALAFFGISTMNYLLTLHNHAQVIQKTHEAISSATVVNYNIYLKTRKIKPRANHTSIRDINGLP